MKILKQIQDQLENQYGVKTGLDVRNFVQLKDNHKELGSLLVHQESNNIDLALLLDRDIFEAWNRSPRSVSVPCEEISHFVYLGYNHQRGRNITRFEMEIQSEVDRVLLAFHGNLNISEKNKDYLYKELCNHHYCLENYEKARLAAHRFISSLGHPKAWTNNELSKIRKFFHSDLAEKLHIAYNKR